MVGGGKRATNWDFRIDYTLPCVKQIASGKPLYSTGSSAQCSVMTKRGGMGVDGGEKGSRRRGHMYTYS